MHGVQNFSYHLSRVDLLVNVFVFLVPEHAIVNCNTDISVSEFQLQSRGSFREFEVESFCCIESTSPVLVAQYAYGGTSDGVEDPCIHDDNPSN